MQGRATILAQDNLLVSTEIYSYQTDKKSLSRGMKVIEGIRNFFKNSFKGDNNSES